MAGRLADSQEDERRRIAREIHDDFTQRLALVSMKIADLVGRGRTSASTKLNSDLEDVRKSISSVASDLRDLSHQLHPATLEILGLVRALEAQCEEFQRVCGIKTVFDTSASDEDASPQCATCLYRVLQESLRNITKHSGSATARVTLTRQGDHLEMRIRDEGQGFVFSDKSREGLGLKSIEERVRLAGGKLIVNSAPDRGTEIIVQVPVRVSPIV